MGVKYLSKSFQDKYEFGPSEDLAVFFRYKVNNKLDVDATISNGDGYKDLTIDNVLKYSVGITLKPFENFNIRVYYDYMGFENIQQSISLFAAYSTSKIKFGAEYNQQLNHNMIKDNNMEGYSIYSS